LKPGAPYGPLDNMTSLEREKWLEDNADGLSRMDRMSNSSQNQLAGTGVVPPMPMSAPPAGAHTTAEDRQMKSYYTDGLLDALRSQIVSAANNSSSHRGSQSSSGPTFGAHRSSAASLNEELRKNLGAEGYLDYAPPGKAGSREKLEPGGGPPQPVPPPPQNPNQQSQPGQPPATGGDPRGPEPIRIRNLEDLIRQLDHRSRHMSSPGSDELRDGDQDRHFRYSIAFFLRTPTISNLLVPCLSCS